MHPYLALLSLIVSLSAVVYGLNVVELDKHNINKELKSKKVVFVNFYAKWCRFSQMLKPIYEQAADILKEEFPTDLTLAKLNCESEKDLCQTYHVSKYPTLKIFRNAEPTKREFRGQRTVDGLSKFCREQLQTKLNEFHQLQDLKYDESKGNVVAFLESKDSDNYRTFEKVAEELRDSCEFFFGVGDASLKERPTGDNIAFRTNNRGYLYRGDLTNYDQLKAWVNDQCVPLVRQITFENAEEYTEEGLPFLLLFHHPDDKTSPELYKTTIANHFTNERGNINFLTADGLQFSHPLHHLGKSANDLPLIAIDSFRHMYTFPRFDDIKDHTKLAQFMQDFHSGKLHREFHHGPDPTQPPRVEEQDQQQPHEQQQQQQQQGGARDQNQVVDDDKQTDPPETVFKKLGPSDDRYTLLHKDEL